MCMVIPTHHNIPSFRRRLFLPALKLTPIRTYKFIHKFQAGTRHGVLEIMLRGLQARSQLDSDGVMEGGEDGLSL